MFLFQSGNEATQTYEPRVMFKEDRGALPCAYEIKFWVLFKRKRQDPTRMALH